MLSFHRRCWDDLGEATVKNDPNFEERVDIVGISPFEDSKITKDILKYSENIVMWKLIKSHSFLISKFGLRENLFSGLLVNLLWAI